MSRRIVFEARREGRRVVLRRRRPVVSWLSWSLLAVPVGAGAAAESWRLLGATAGQVTRAAYAVVVFGLVAGSIRLARGGKR